MARTATPVESPFARLDGLFQSPPRPSNHDGAPHLSTAFRKRQPHLDLPRRTGGDIFRSSNGAWTMLDTRHVTQSAIRWAAIIVAAVALTFLSMVGMVGW